MITLLIAVAATAALVVGLFTWRQGKAEYDPYIGNFLVRRQRYRRRLLRTVASALVGASLGTSAVGFAILWARPPS